MQGKQQSYIKFIILHILKQRLAQWDKCTVFLSGARKQWPLGYDTLWLMEIKVMSNLKKDTLNVQALTMQGLSLRALNASNENICNHSQKQSWLSDDHLPASICFLPHLLLSKSPSLGNLKELSPWNQWLEPAQNQTGSGAFAAFKENKKVSPEAQKRADKNNAEVKYGNSTRFCWLKREFLRIFLAQ